MLRLTQPSELLDQKRIVWVVLNTFLLLHFTDFGDGGNRGFRHEGGMCIHTSIRSSSVIEFWYLDQVGEEMALGVKQFIAMPKRNLPPCNFNVDIVATATANQAAKWVRKKHRMQHSTHGARAAGRAPRDRRLVKHSVCFLDPFCLKLCDAHTVIFPLARNC